MASGFSFGQCNSVGRPTGAYSDVLDIHDSIKPREGHEHSLPFDDKARRMLIFFKK